MWFYIYATVDGSLLSESSIDPGAQPAGRAVVSRVTRFDPRTEMWDAPTHSFIARPAPPVPQIQLDIDTALAIPNASWTLQNTAAALKLILRILKKMGAGTD